MLQEVLLPEPHVFFVCIEVEEGFLHRHVEWISVNINRLLNLAPEGNCFIRGLILVHLALAITEEITIEMGVGLLT